MQQANAEPGGVLADHAVAVLVAPRTQDVPELGGNPGIGSATPGDFGIGRLFWAIRDAVVVGDAETGRIVLWNPAAEGLFGIPAAEAIGQPIAMLVPEALRERHRAGLARFRETGDGAFIESGQPLELPALRRTGEPITIELTLSPITASGDAGRYVLAIIRDATLRKQAEADRLRLAREQAARVAAERAEEDLRQSEERFRTAFDYAAIGKDLVDLEGRFLQVNAALCALLGYSEAELLATTFQDLTYEDDLSADLTQMDRLLAGEIPAFQMEKRYRRKDGTIVWGRVNTSLLRDGHGTPLYYISQIEDITERKAAEATLLKRTEELRASETRFRTLVEQLPAVVYLLATREEDERPLYFSPSIKTVTGETPEEALVSHQHWLDLVHPEDRARVATLDERAGARVTPFRAEYRHRRTDGTYVWVQDEHAHVKDETGRVVARLGVMLDITDRIRADDAQARLAAIVASAEDAIISTDLDGHITSWNRGAERLFGYDAAAALGLPFTKLLPDDPSDPTLAWRHVALAGGSVPPFEATRRRRDGSTFAASIAISPIRDRAGQIVGISSVNRDVSARKQMEVKLRAALEAAESANQAKSSFLAMMSHELRTPLQAVLGYAEFLLARGEERFTDEEREDLGYIQQGGQRMLALVNQLLDLSRLEAGRLEVTHKPVDLAAVIAQVRQDVAPQVTQQGLALGIDLPAALPPVCGDAERLRQILLNLVGNAVKFTNHGSVTIGAVATEDEVAVSVADTGIGIAPDFLPRIFDAFRQVDSRLARHHGGAGLGLAIAQRLAELMGGRITVESTLGEGSIFTMTMPAAPRQPD